MKSPHSVSAVVPIYNERGLLRPAIAEIDRYLASTFADYEIVVVESGSTDGTGEECDAVAKEFPKVRVHHEGRRNGFGSAVRAGGSLSTKEWVWPLVVDMPFPLETMTGALPYLDRYRAVLSYRSKDPRNLYRKFQSLVFNASARRLLGIHVRHVNSAFKLVRTDVFQSLALKANGWLLDAELIVGLERRGIDYVEIPVEVMPRLEGRSSIGVRAVVRAVLDLLALAAERRSGVPVADAAGPDARRRS